MNDAVENLVLADGQCNLRKSDYLCSPDVVVRWIERLRTRRTELADAALTVGWTSAIVCTIRSAVVQYEAFGTGDRGASVERARDRGGGTGDRPPGAALRSFLREVS